MINKIFFLKKFFTFLPIFLQKYIRKKYNSFRNQAYIIPIKIENTVEEIIAEKKFKLNAKNFDKLKRNYKFFLIFRRNSIKDYSLVKLKKLLDLIKDNETDIAYDGDDPFHTEISSEKVLELYQKKFLIDHYPNRFFYIKDSLKMKNLGSRHRNFNFNATFNLPSGGRSIGDGGPVENRLKYIPDLLGKSFLDIGTEEGYSVFNAITKNAKFAKGLNINESKEYDYFPDYSRPDYITPRKREEIEKTQKFLMREYKLERSEKIKFEYNNIYNLGTEKFDFVFCFGVLYHLKNPYLAIENLFKVTSETLVLETQGVKNQKYLNAGISMEDGFIRHSSNALKYLLKRAGFKKVEIMLDAYDKKTLVEPNDGTSNIQNIVLIAKKY